VFNGDMAIHHTTKTAKIKKVLLYLQHVAIMLTCFYVIAPFLFLQF